MSFITKKHIKRRTFLQGAGATLALPVLEAMIPATTAAAQTAAEADEAFLEAADDGSGDEGDDRPVEPVHNGWPVSNRYASWYFSLVRSTTSSGSTGAGGCLFHPIFSSQSRSNFDPSRYRYRRLSRPQGRAAFMESGAAAATNRRD